ncbi:MAG TPA: AraC family transcriptional regulator [Vicinamibacterales bacterium]|nr:AraC family transcriptional regulator [Vicinamibacterales bacterium]
MTAARERALSGNPSRILFESPLVQVGAFRCPTDHPRFNDSGPTKRYCFVFPRTSVWIAHEGRRPFVADSTIVPLYNAGHPYRRQAIDRDGDRTDWYGVTPSLLREMLRDRRPASADHDQRLFDADFARVGAATFLRQRRLFHRVQSQEITDGLDVEESVVGMLDHVLTGLQAPVERDDRARHRDLAESVRAHLSTRFADRQDLTTLAAALGTSVYHLCRVFKSHAGQTIHQYRTELRLRHSLERIADSRADILTVALELGFSGHSHFTDVFRHRFGITPSAYSAVLRRSARRARAIAGPLRARF